MPKIATSLKLPEDLKTRVEAAAEAAGKTPHAFMVDAIERETSRAELYEAFVQEAIAADEEAERSGLYYAAEDVYRYMADLAQGKAIKRPKPRTWRK